MFRLTTTHKLTLLLAMLSLGSASISALNGLEREAERRLLTRVMASEQLALACALNLDDLEAGRVRSLMEAFRDRAKPESVRLIRFDGFVIEEVGSAAKGEFDFDAAESTATDIRIPISRRGREWGMLQTCYAERSVWQTYFPVSKSLGLQLLFNLFLFGLLLRRALATLDNSKTAPKRVRNTINTLAGGVVILDGKREIVAANDAFQKCAGASLEDLLGKELGQLPFRLREGNRMPWDIAIESSQQQTGVTVFLQSEHAMQHCFVVNATPVFNGAEVMAGTLVSFEDITDLEQQKESLLNAMTELEASKEKVHQQNLRLQELASRDVLTGVFNRRALFEQFEAMWAEREQVELNCIMLDVDHFKKLNDNYGHAVGDQVLRDVSRTIQECLQEPSYVGRYGGEEFCIVCPGMDVEAATAIGETVRAVMEAKLAEPYAVTASFGVSGTSLGATTYQQMLEQADQALYVAKDGGRNAVRCWSLDLAALEEASKDVSLPSVSLDEQPISYHAVASLHSALAFRDADTALHCQRVAEYAVSLGRGLMTISELYVLELAGILHDIGKVGVPDSILLKPGKLDEAEWKVMEAHARMGVEIVDSSFNSKFLSDIIRYHHCRYDGTKATDEIALYGKDIPLGARIVCIVDAFDAMVSDRVYRKGRTAEEAFAELRRCAGTQFDPELVELFIRRGVGWRPDSRYSQRDADQKVAVTVGHLTERTVFAFETHDFEVASNMLFQMERIASQCDYPAIANLSAELRSMLGSQRKEAWEEAMPILQHLLEMCMMVQRSHIRTIAARPQETIDCPQQGYYLKAREWENDRFYHDAVDPVTDTVV